MYSPRGRPGRLPQLDDKLPKGKSLFFYIAYPTALNRVFSLHREHRVIITAVGVTTKSALQCGEAMLSRPTAAPTWEDLAQTCPDFRLCFWFFLFSCNSSNSIKEKNKSSTQSRNCKSAKTIFHKILHGTCPLPDHVHCIAVICVKCKCVS